MKGMYLTLPFDVPPDIESFVIHYYYDRFQEGINEGEKEGYITRREKNIVDIGLIAPDGVQVGASGSDKDQIEISETYTTPGYRPYPLIPGEWKIIVGVYKTQPKGVTVHYDISFTPKHRRLLKGDLHVHTINSDGVLSADELAQHCKRHGLDFLAITDHNQMSTDDTLPHLPGLTLIPGIEWTHFRGHATFLGVNKPYDEPFFANSPEEIKRRFDSARARGATIVICHPFDEVCPFQFDMNSLPYDCLEIWNGPMRESNVRSVGLWHSLLMAGKKVPISGGSDYHRDQLFLIPGGPTTCVFAMSASPADILAALRQGHAYIIFAPNGPSVEISAGPAIMGDSVSFNSVQEMQINAMGLQIGDTLQVTTGSGSTPLLKAGSNGRFSGTYHMEKPGFARVEILRVFLPSLPSLPALISNPIYFTEG